MTNPVYLGWWIVQGDIISDHNHEPIFDAEHEYLFWYAFNRLAPYTTKGEINVKRVVKGTKRFYQTDTTAQKGLLKDKITSPHGTTYVHIVAGSHRYNIIPQTSTSLVRIGQTAIEASVIDDAFTAQFFKRLQETRDFDVYRRWLADEQGRENGENGE